MSNREHVVVESRNVYNFGEMSWKPFAVDESINGDCPDSMSVEQFRRDALDKPVTIRYSGVSGKPVPISSHMTSSRAVGVPG